MMKKTILTLAFAMPAMAGTPAPVVSVAPVAPAPIAPVAGPCALEVAGMYRWADRPIYTDDKHVDVYGLDLTAVHSFSINHAVTLRLGYAYGSEKLVYGPGDYDRYKMENVSLMPGYRYTLPLADDLNLFAGVNAGISYSKMKETVFTGTGWDISKDHAWGFSASAELGLSYNLCENVYVFAAYELSGNTAKLNPSGAERTHRQLYQGVRAGVGFKF